MEEREREKIPHLVSLTWVNDVRSELPWNRQLKDTRGGFESTSHVSWTVSWRDTPNTNLREEEKMSVSDVARGEGPGILTLHRTCTLARI